MNIRNPVDYSVMYTGLDQAVGRSLPQMKLYLEIGKLVNARTEKGAAVAAAEYLTAKYPNISGFSPRNLRRMRDFFRTMENLLNIVSVVTTGERNGNLPYLYIGKEQVEHGILFANHTSRHMVPDYYFGIE